VRHEKERTLALHGDADMDAQLARTLIGA